jgi:protein TonB
MRLRKSIPVILFFFLCLGKGFSQDGNLYLFNEKWESISDAKKAKYFLEIRKTNDTLWQGWYYNFNGPLVRTESYKKFENQILNGRTSFYKSDGYLDSIINYKDGIPDGTCYYYGDTGRVEKTRIYANGNLIKENVKCEIDEYHRLDILNSDMEEESKFPGGIGAWKRFLSKYLNYPQRAYTNKFEGTVYVSFTVLEDGKLAAFDIFRSVEYSIDKEAMDVMKKCPDWIPGKKNGVNIKTYKRQPINFRLQ